MVGGGLIGVALDELLNRRMAASWRRVVRGLDVDDAAGVVAGADHRGGHLLMRGRFTLEGLSGGCNGRCGRSLLAVMAVRALVWRRLPARVETRTVIAPPLPEAEAAFRRRLSAKRRTARLIAVEAHDHYLKVHTDAGEELITLRFADALEELAGPRLARPPLVVGRGRGGGSRPLAARRRRGPPRRRPGGAGQPDLCAGAERGGLVLIVGARRANADTFGCRAYAPQLSRTIRSVGRRSGRWSPSSSRMRETSRRPAL
jgi:hypothetical protein